MKINYSCQADLAAVDVFTSMLKITEVILGESLSQFAITDTKSEKWPGRTI